MSAAKGAGRIKVAGKLVLIVGSGAAVLLWLVVMVMGTNKVSAIEQLIAFLFLPLLFGGVLWTAGWILEGFFEAPTQRKS
jgi:hypothetical protein